MSRSGPTLRRDPRGYGYAKFNGVKLNFGPFDDPRSHAEFASVKNAWLENGRRLPSERPEDTPPLGVGQVAERYLAHLRERHDEAWRKNNEPRHLLALRPLRAPFEQFPAREFSPKRLKEVRRRMIDSGTLCRKEINERIRTIQRMFRWAVSEELVPTGIRHGLEAVDALRAGEFGVRESRTRESIDAEAVQATLPYLGRQVSAIVQLLLRTGARPSEILNLRPMD